MRGGGFFLKSPALHPPKKRSVSEDGGKIIEGESKGVQLGGAEWRSDGQQAEESRGKSYIEVHNRGERPHVARINARYASPTVEKWRGIYGEMQKTALTVADLAVTPADIMAAGVPQNQIAKTAEALLIEVAVHGLPNEKAVIIAHVKNKTCRTRARPNP